MRTVLLASSLGYCVLLAGCASTDGENYAVSRAEREAAAMADYARLNEQKAELWDLGFEPQHFDFPGHGKVTVSEWSLTGWPGEVHVNARVRYVNTTDRPVRGAVVWLEVLDSKEYVGGSTGIRMINPVGYPIWPGASITMQVRAPTGDAHLDPDGWQWGISCNAEVAEDPGTKPVLVVTRDRAANFAPGQPSAASKQRARESWTWSAPEARRSAPTWRGPHRPGVDYWDRWR